MSLGDTRLLPRWGPAYRQHEPDLGSRTERVKANPILPPAGWSGARGRTPSGGIREGLSTDAGTLADPPVVAVILVNKKAGSEAVMVGGGLVDCGAVREMEVCWPSRVGFAEEALNRREGPWLKTVVLNVVGKGAAEDRVRCGPGR
jgi:hypothetical protein